jgi:hypothetical protein
MPYALTKIMTSGEILQQPCANHWDRRIERKETGACNTSTPASKLGGVRADQQLCQRPVKSVTS